MASRHNTQHLPLFIRQVLYPPYIAEYNYWIILIGAKKGRVHMN